MQGGSNSKKLKQKEQKKNLFWGKNNLFLWSLWVAMPEVNLIRAPPPKIRGLQIFHSHRNSARKGKKTQKKTGKENNRRKKKKKTLSCSDLLCH